MNYRYVTLLTSDNYINGVLLLEQSLKLVNSKYKLLCLITDNLSEQTLNILSTMKIETKLVDNISVSDRLYEHNKRSDEKRAGIWKNTFTKFHIFELEEYDKIIFLDADLLITKNIDHCFEFESLTAAIDGEYFNLWPNDLHFNSGFMVIKPSKKTYTDLLNYVENLDPDTLKNYLGLQFLIADQDILNIYFDDWKKSPNRQLNKYYNVFGPYIQNETEQDIIDNAYFIHFVGIKPWETKDSGEASINTGVSSRSTYFYEKAAGIIQYLYETNFSDIDMQDKETLALVTARLAFSRFKKPADVGKFYKDELFEKAQDIKKFLIPLMEYIFRQNVCSGAYLAEAVANMYADNTEMILLYYNMLEDAIKNALGRL